jgi:hypothetical protein
MRYSLSTILFIAFLTFTIAKKIKESNEKSNANSQSHGQYHPPPTDINVFNFFFCLEAVWEGISDDNNLLSPAQLLAELTQFSTQSGVALPTTDDFNAVITEIAPFQGYIYEWQYKEFTYGTVIGEIPVVADFDAIVEDFFVYVAFNELSRNRPTINKNNLINAWSFFSQETQVFGPFMPLPTRAAINAAFTKYDADNSSSWDINEFGNFLGDSVAAIQSSYNQS